MGQLIITEREYKEFLKTFNPDISESIILEWDLEKILKRKFTGEYRWWLVLNRGDIIMFDNILTPYLGVVNSIYDIDQYVSSIYRIGRWVYYHKARSREKTDWRQVPVKKKQKDTSELLDVRIRENDNELLVIIKELLNGMTVDAFKNLFTSTSDFNNIKREICDDTSSKQMTFNRFKYLLSLLGFDYKLEVTKVINSNDLNKPKN